MLRIIKHIEHLLSAHDCVIVPDFGGFVLQSIPTLSKYEADVHLFEPARKEIVFNETLQYNDGLLIESYMQAEHTDYRTARQLVYEDINALKEALHRDGTLQMNAVGSFSFGNEGQLIFQADEADWLNASMYGLPVFTFEPLNERLPESSVAKHSDEKEVYYIPINRRLVRSVVSVAAAVTLFFTISTPVKDVNRLAYTASFVPTEMITSDVWASKKVQQPEAPETKSDVKTEKEADAVIIPEQPKPEVVKKETQEAEVKKAVEVKPVPKVEKTASQKMYHVVIASFPTKEQADQYMDKMGQKDCPHMNVVRSKGKFRIYADRFTDRKEAESYMTALRKNEKYKDAWLFISR